METTQITFSRCALPHLAPSARTKNCSCILGEDEAARLTALGARIIQVNVWRPIRGPVERSPLALADASSVHQDDLIATDQIFPDRVGEIYNLAHAPSQRWYHAPRMTTDEVLLIKGWDSLDDGRARFTPHGAFNSPETREDAPARESIEVRTFVVVDDDPKISRRQVSAPDGSSAANDNSTKGAENIHVHREDDYGYARARSKSVMQSIFPAS